MLRKANHLVLAACLLLPGAVAAQSALPLLDAYGRSIALLNFMTSYVSVSLLACAENGILTEAQAEVRFQAYRERNAALLKRAENWRQEAEKRLRAEGKEGAAQERADEVGGSATSLALARVQEEISRISNFRALCAGKIEGIEAGRYDLSLNAEFVALLRKSP